MSLSLTSRERLGALGVLALSLLLTAAGWWWRARTQAEAHATTVTVRALPTEVLYEAVANRKTSRKVRRDSLYNDSLRTDTKRQHLQHDRNRRRTKSGASGYTERHPLDEHIETQ